MTGSAWSRTPGCYYGGCYGGDCNSTYRAPPPVGTNCSNHGVSCHVDSDCCWSKCDHNVCGTYFWNFDLFSDSKGCADTTKPNFTGTCTRLTCLPAASVCKVNQDCCSGCCGSNGRCGVYIDYYAGDLVNGTWSSTPGCYFGNCYGGACPVSSQQQDSFISCQPSGTRCTNGGDCCSNLCCNKICGVYLADTNTCFDYPSSCVNTSQPFDVGACPP